MVSTVRFQVTIVERTCQVWSGFDELKKVHDGHVKPPDEQREKWREYSGMRREKREERIVVERIVCKHWEWGWNEERKIVGNQQEYAYPLDLCSVNERQAISQESIPTLYWEQVNSGFKFQKKN